MFSLCFISVTDLRAEEAKQLQSRDAYIFFPHILNTKAQTVIRMLPELKSELENKLLLKWPSALKPTIFLMEDQAKFEKMTDNPYISAFAVPAKQLIVIDCTRVNVRPLTLEITLKHELCHLLLHAHLPNLPKWLDEGVCQWASDGISELVMDKKGDMIRGALISGNMLRLREMETSFPYHKNGLLLAYEESKSITEFIVREFGTGALTDILDMLGKGEDTDTAFRKTLSLSLEQTEAQWHEHLRETGTWLIWFSVHIYEILFFLTSLATVFGFIRLVFRKRNYPDDDEAEEDYAEEDYDTEDYDTEEEGMDSTDHEKNGNEEKVI